MPDDWRNGGFGLYIHWPFCAAKCPYCDFNSHVVRSVDTEAWAKAYLSELERYGAETGDRVLNSVYFGGGTPSLMDPSLVEAILGKVAQHWRFANDLEITLEANPSSVEAGRFSAYRGAGVNRVSLGVQALNDADLRALGRLHDVAQALSALEVARSTFERVSFDLIYARQDQSLEAWRNELERGLSFTPDHLSLYQLTVEDGTAFGDRHRRGRLPGLPDEDLAADMYFLTQSLCEEAGLPAYEVSNHARTGQESRHNLIYWRGGDYVGIGPGAHGRLTLDGIRYATTTRLEPASWLRDVAKGMSGELSRVQLSRQDHASEYLMMSLRMVEGTDLARFRAILQKTIDPVKLKDLDGLGLIEVKDDHIKATAAGRAVLNAIITELMPD